MKYVDFKFSVPLGGEKYGEGWDRTFGPKKGETMRRSGEAIAADTKKVYEALDFAGPLTAKDVATSTGLSLSQVSARLEELVAKGLVTSAPLVVPHERKRGPKPQGFTKVLPVVALP